MPGGGGTAGQRPMVAVEAVLRGPDHIFETEMRLQLARIQTYVVQGNQQVASEESHRVIGYYWPVDPKFASKNVQVHRAILRCHDIKISCTGKEL